MNLNNPFLLKPGALAQAIENLGTGGHTDQMRHMDREIQIKNGVAVVDVDGVLLERADFFDAMTSDGFSLTRLTAKIEELKKDPQIKTVVFNFATPGGDVGGTQNAARSIKALSEAGKKTVAYINSLACSGGTWLAVACNEVILSSDTSEMGSVGVVIAHREISELEKKIGVKTTEITAGDKKRAWSFYEPLSEEGKNALEERAKTIHGIFIANVEEYRPQMSENRPEWIEGQIFIGAQAVEVGLADKVEYIPNLFEIGEQDVDLDKLKLDFPKVFEEAVAVGRREANTVTVEAIESAKKEGEDTERARVAAILNVKMDGYGDAKAAAIRNGGSVEDLAVAIVQGTVERDKEPVQPKAGVVPTPGPSDLKNALLGESPPVVQSKIEQGEKEIKEAEIARCIEVAAKAANRS